MTDDTMNSSTQHQRDIDQLRRALTNCLVERMNLEDALILAKRQRDRAIAKVNTHLDGTMLEYHPDQEGPYT